MSFTAVVTFVNVDRGFYFARIPGHPTDVFCHAVVSAFPIEELHKGSLVEIDELEPDPNGRPCPRATSVSKPDYVHREERTLERKTQ